MTEAEINDAYCLAQHLALLPPLNPRVIIVTDEDVYWASEKGIHSLEVTRRYGTHEVGCLSLPVKALFAGQTLVEGENWNPKAGTITWRVGEHRLSYDYRHSNPEPGGEKRWALLD